jgi:hypothetical protein
MLECKVHVAPIERVRIESRSRLLNRDELEVFEIEGQDDKGTDKVRGRMAKVLLGQREPCADFDMDDC